MNAIKGVILAGGKGLRLYPLTKVTNKHLLPVGREPMILNPVKKLIESGITDILVVTSTEHMGSMINLLGSGKEFGCSFTYRVQEAAGGIAHALALAEDFAGSAKLVVILGDNITSGSIKSHVEKFANQAKGAMVLVKKVADPERFGIAVMDERQIVAIEEKPKEPKSNYAVIGYYMYDPKVFEIIRRLRPSARGELEITDVNNEYIGRGELMFEILNDDWTDAGTFESLLYANQMMLRRENESAPKLISQEQFLVSREQIADMISEHEIKAEELRKYLGNDRSK